MTCCRSVHLYRSIRSRGSVERPGYMTVEIMSSLTATPMVRLQLILSGGYTVKTLPVLLMVGAVIVSGVRSACSADAALDTSNRHFHLVVAGGLDFRLGKSVVDYEIERRGCSTETTVRMASRIRPARITGLLLDPSEKNVGILLTLDLWPKEGKLIQGFSMGVGWRTAPRVAIVAAYSLRRGYKIRPSCTKCTTPHVVPTFNEFITFGAGVATATDFSKLNDAFQLE